MDAQLKVILERIDKIQIVVDSIESDMEKIYKDNQELSIIVHSLKAEQEGMRKLINHSMDRTQDKVAEALQPVIDETGKLRKTIEKKKTMVIREKTKSLWRRILRR